jgi:AcrR family transcriptional regulator
MTMRLNTGRSNQKERTRAAIVAAAREAVTSGGEVTMPDVARRALVSEATAYRYFPDLASLLREVLAGVWDSPQQAMEPVADCADPVERIGFAAEVLLSEVLAYQGAVRAMIAASITKPPVTALRPGRRFGLIDEALRPLNDTMAVSKPAQFEQLKRGLAVVISAEALFTLTDLCGLTPEAAIATAVRTARSLTTAALAETGSLRVLQVRPLPLLGLLVAGPGLLGSLETGHLGYRHVPPGVARRRGQQRVGLDVHERGPVRRPSLDQG